MKPRVAQLHRSGATDGQVVTWSTALGYWVPSAVSVTYSRASAVAVGGETIVYFGGVPVTNSDQIFKNGLYLTPGTDYTVSGAVATLTTPLSAADKVTVYLVSSSGSVTPTIALRPKGYKRPTTVTRPVRRFHRIR